MKASDRYKIALNIAAKLGLDHPSFITEYSKAVSQTHVMDSMSAMAPLMPPLPPQGGVGTPMEGQPPQGMPEEQMMPPEPSGMV